MKRILLFVVMTAGIFFSGCSSQMYLVRGTGEPKKITTSPFRPTKIILMDDKGVVTEVDSRPSDFYYRDKEGNIVRYSSQYYPYHRGGYVPYSSVYGY